MKYELIKWDFSSQSATDEKGNYSVKVTIALHPTDGIAPDFSKDIIVVSNNDMTGHQVDAQREQEVDNYILEINKS